MYLNMVAGYPHHKNKADDVFINGLDLLDRGIMIIKRDKYCITFKGLWLIFVFEEEFLRFFIKV